MEIDYQVFEWFNSGLAHPLLDRLLPYYRDKLTWIPLYGIALVLLYRQRGWRDTLTIVVGLAVVLTVADQLAASLIKPRVGRLRPCATESLFAVVRELVPCGGKYGFPSNHATNHFAVAVYLCGVWVRRRGLRVAWLLWALSIGLAQVYVGKHFPLDILGGAFLGSGIALIGVAGYRRYFAPAG
jgi:undecaprenyl-diphosphatase